MTGSGDVANVPFWLENEIVGEALIALKHDELKEMGIASVGHRLTILKSVYETKVKQEVPLDPDHYIPLCMWLTPRPSGIQSTDNRIQQPPTKASMKMLPKKI